MRTKSNLDNARRNKNDEYYTYYVRVILMRATLLSI